MTTLHYHQPYITSYRREVVAALAKRHAVHVYADVKNHSRLGFETIDEDSCVITHAPTVPLIGGRLQIQRRVLRGVMSERPQVLLLCANPRLLSFWITLLLARALRLRAVCHGQAMFGHPNPGKLRTRLYKWMVAMSKGYVCYSHDARTQLLNIGCRADKVFVAENSVKLDATVDPGDRSYSERGVLFMGRLRQGSDVLRLIKAMKQLNASTEDPVALHVIGGGEIEHLVRERYSDLDWLVLHGPVFDDAAIAKISRRCRLGAYTGDAGLSVVHYFGLALPVLTHDCIHEHMGPEPGYVNDENGFLFDRLASVNTLALRLADIFAQDVQEFQRRGASAFARYTELNSPALGEQLSEIIENCA